MGDFKDRESPPPMAGDPSDKLSHSQNTFSTPSNQYPSQLFGSQTQTVKLSYQLKGGELGG